MLEDLYLGYGSQVARPRWPVHLQSFLGSGLAQPGNMRLLGNSRKRRLFFFPPAKICSAFLNRSFVVLRSIDGLTSKLTETNRLYLIRHTIIQNFLTPFHAKIVPV